MTSKKQNGRGTPLITDANKQKATVGVLEKLRAGGPPPPRTSEMEEPEVVEAEVSVPKKRKKKPLYQDNYYDESRFLEEEGDSGEFVPANMPVPVTGRN